VHNPCMPIKTHTNAAASFPGAMRKLLTELSLTIAAFVCGVTLGYFVIDAPIIPVATASAIEWLVPLVKEIDAWLYVRKAEYLVVAVLVFVANVPNVALLSILVALSMKWLRRPRWVFYSTLLWPVYHFFLDARQLARFMANLERRGPGLPHSDAIMRLVLPKRNRGSHSRRYAEVL